MALFLVGHEFLHVVSFMCIEHASQERSTCQKSLHVQNMLHKKDRHVRNPCMAIMYTTWQHVLIAPPETKNCATQMKELWNATKIKAACTRPFSSSKDQCRDLSSCSFAASSLLKGKRWSLLCQPKLLAFIMGEFRLLLLAIDVQHHELPLLFGQASKLEELLGIFLSVRMPQLQLNLFLAICWTSLLSCHKL